jgi:hypothetical protein
MINKRTFVLAGAFAGWILFPSNCPHLSAAEPGLPAPVAINPEAGRGGFLAVPVRVGDGADELFIVDCGTTGTLFDKSLEPKLGKALGQGNMQSWGKKKPVNVYAMPKLYLGGVQLATEDRTVALDLQLPVIGGRHVGGMLGYNTLRHYCIQLDFAASQMRFLNDQQADKTTWGRAFPIVPLNDRDERPAVAANLLGLRGPHSLIDSGFPSDGWLMPQYFLQWTNNAVPPGKDECRSPSGMFEGEKYPLADLQRNDVESDGIGLRFLARHLVTLDFPGQTLYLKRQSVGPLSNPDLKSGRMKALDALVSDLLQEDADAARRELERIQQSGATELEKTVARKLVQTLQNTAKPMPADAAPEMVELPLGDAQATRAEVGWLKPAANRIPLNAEVASPLLDSGGIFATGLFAHSPSRYVYQLGGKWNHLRGQAGIHTDFQNRAFGVVFVIRADGREVFRSGSVRGSEHPRYDIDVTGINTLELIVEKAGKQNGGNWALWLDPTLFRK